MGRESNLEISLLKNKEFCKAVAKEQPLEDYYLEELIREKSKTESLEVHIETLKKQVESLTKKVEQYSKPVEQRVAELEQQVEIIKKTIRDHNQVINLHRPMR